MDGVEFLKDQAANLRKFAEMETDPEEGERLLELARRCDRLIEIMEGHGRDP
jgi:hypothetical protein